MTEEEKQKENEKKNREQLLIALALLLYPNVDERTLTVETIPEEVRTRLEKKIDDFLDKDNKLTGMSKSDILKDAKEISGVKSMYFQVITVGDSKTCESCRKWNGKVISDDDDDYPSYDDLEKSGALHPNCRCYLKPVDKKAMNSENINDEIVFDDKTLINNSMENIITDTIDNGIVENVHISPIGDFTGSKQDGSPQNEHITAEALSALADKMNAGDEVLCDVDHQSCRPGVEKDTSAAGWFTKFVVDPIKGLFANLKLTKRGKDLLANREYRYTSPTFMLNDNGEPIDIHSVSLTNTPAFKGFINPVINSEATPIDDTNESITNMTKEELVNLIKETVVEMNACSAKKDGEVNNEVVDQTKVEETKEETVDDTKQEVKNEVAAEPMVEETKVEETKKTKPAIVIEETKVEEKKEVIKEEALNSAPTIGSDVSSKAEWMKLRGKEFFAYLKNHPEIR